MALTPSGAISMSNINTALNLGASASISFNDTKVRFLANQTSGSVNLNNMRNKNSTAGTVTVAAYDDGKGSINYGFLDTVFGAASTNSFYTSVLEGIFTLSDGSLYLQIKSPYVNSLGQTARVSINGLTANVLPNANPTQAWQQFVLPPVLMYAGLVGSTVSFQFAQN